MEIAYAQAGTIRDANGLIDRLLDLGDAFTIILVSFAVIWIIYFTVRYFIAQGDNENRSAAGWSIFWGIVGLFIILSIWGLVNILKNSFKTENTVPRGDIPGVIRPGGNSRLIDAPSGFGEDCTNVC